MGVHVDAPQGPVEVAQLDLADLSSVARFEARLEAEPRLDALVCNAGVMMCPFQHTKDGFEMQIGTNHHGAQGLMLTDQCLRGSCASGK